MPKKIKEKERIIMEWWVDRYTVSGVPSSYLTRMCKDAGINEKKLRKWLVGQTSGLVGGEALIYPWDIKRFLNDSPIWD